MKINNIKISVYLSGDLCEKEKSNRKTIYKHGSWTFTIYRHSPRLINVTGLKHECDIDKVINHIENIYAKKCVKYQIDSVMITHKDNKRLNMNDVMKNAKTFLDMYYIDYNPELFTGLYLKPFNREFPTVNNIYTGSFQLLGGKSFQKINTIFHLIHHLIKKSEKTWDAVIQNLNV